MNIGRASDQSGLPVKTIRYYEEIGLLKPQRRDNGYRDYCGTDIHKLRFIQRSRSLGFDIETCRQLLGLYEDGGRASAQVKDLAIKHLDELERKAAELRAMSDALRSLITACHGDSRPDCPILDDLAGQVAGKASKH